MAGNTSRQALHLFALWQVIGLGMLAYIVYVSLIPHPPLMFGQWSDKVYHFVGYFVLTAWYAQLYAASRHRYLLALSFLSLGVLLEFAQLLVNERSFELLDMLANGLGVLVAWLITRGRLSRLLLYCEQKILSGK
jgi:VanZ family protein